MKVLIVDDEKLSRKTLGFYMEKLGYKVFRSKTDGRLCSAGVKNFPKSS